MKKKKITISWAFGTNPIMQTDFGRFPAHKANRIEVDEKSWNDYCDLRLKFWIAQKKLSDLIKKK